MKPNRNNNVQYFMTYNHRGSKILWDEILFQNIIVNYINLWLLILLLPCAKFNSLIATRCWARISSRCKSIIKLFPIVDFWAISFSEDTSKFCSFNISWLKRGKKLMFKYLYQSLEILILKIVSQTTIKSNIYTKNISKTKQYIHDSYSCNNTILKRKLMKNAVLNVSHIYCISNFQLFRKTFFLLFHSSKQKSKLHNVSHSP